MFLRREGENPDRGFRCRAALEGENQGPNLGELFISPGRRKPTELYREASRALKIAPAATARVRALNVPPSCCCSYDSILPIRCQLPFSKFIQVIHIYKIKRPALQEFAISSKSRQNLSHDGYAYANRAEISSASVITTGVSSPTNRMDTLSIAAVTMEPFTHASFQKCFAGVA